MNIERQLGSASPTRQDDTTEPGDISAASLHTADGRAHKPGYVGKVGLVMAGIEITVMFGLVAAAFTLPHVVPEDILSKEKRSYTYMMYAHAAVWIVTLVCDVIFSAHHRRLKMQGYLRLYRAVKYLQRHPFLCKSFASTIYLILTNYLTAICKEMNEKCTLIFPGLTPMYCLQMLVSLETAVMLVGLVIYIGKVVMHNRYSLGPDDANDQLLTSFQQHSLARGNGVGFVADNYLDDLIEHQADTIRSLQEQNAVLNRKLYSATYKNNQRV